MVSAGVSHSAVIYVDAGAAGLNDGTSWTDAYTDLQSALGSATSADEVWVASGTYLPHASDRFVAFDLPDGVEVYGGFAGSETTRAQRDFVANLTILSGNIGVPADSLDNSYHVVTAVGVDQTTVLDGFTIRDGVANSDTLIALLPDLGGGVFSTSSDVVLSNLVITNNAALRAGGGAELQVGSPTVSNVVFDANHSEYTGGGLFTFQIKNASFTNIVFKGNTASFRGGGWHSAHDTSTVITNAVFLDNDAAVSGGGLYPFGSVLTVVNATFTGNTAGVQGGGGIDVAVGNLNLINSIVWDNASVLDPQIRNEATINISYSDIAGSNGSGGSWDAGLGNDLGNNIDADPQFTNAAAGNLVPLAGSPVIDAGDNAANAQTTDLAGEPRVQGGIIDMGAFESQCPSRIVIYVDWSATGANDGTSWADAFYDLQDALAQSRPCASFKEIWVAMGEYYPSINDRTVSFVMADSCAIYGGFNGTETNRDDRAFMTNVCILSGNIGASADSTDNSYHVVFASGVDSTAVLDGFMIMDGQADGPNTADKSGAGAYVTNGSPTLASLFFLRNTAVEQGGGMYNESGSNPAVTGVTFRINVANSGGGAFNSSSSPTFRNVTFDRNSADFLGGGAMNFFLSDPVYTNVIFVDNSALGGGGMINFDRCNTTVTNAMFRQNSADQGGGIADFNRCNTALTNVTLSENSADQGAGILIDDRSTVTVINSVLWANSALVDPEIAILVDSGALISYSLVAGSNGSGGSWNTSVGTDNGNNIDIDPDFVSPGVGNLRLQASSPAIDAGNNSAPDIAATDLDDRYRFVNGTVDMGAYEYNPATGIEDVTPAIPTETAIRSAYPNPFNPTLTVAFDLAQAREVSVVIFDVKGRRVWSTNLGPQTAGTHRVRWDGIDKRGNYVASGVYFVRVATKDWNATRKVVLLK